MKLLQSKQYPNGSLSNEDYHGNDCISGTFLSAVYSKSVKHAMDTVRKPSDALGFGIATHAAILEPELFNQEFAAELNKDDYPFALQSTADMQAWLIARGRPKSGTKAKLVERIKETCEATGDEIPELFEDILAEHAMANEGKVMVKAKDFAQLMNMRDALYSDSVTSSLLTGAYVESSILALIDFYDEFNEGEANEGQWVAWVQIRPDIITRAPSIWDYKTTLDASEEKFGIDAFKLNYWLKMALQKDIFELVTGVEIHELGFIAQEKLAPSQETNPHEHMRYQMTPEQIEEGRKQYLHAMRLVFEYRQTGNKIGYRNRDAMLFTPKWAI